MTWSSSTTASCKRYGRFFHPSSSAVSGGGNVHIADSYPSSAVETSLAEISSLQTELSMNLEVQSENITQLVQDSVMTTHNVGSGNKELKKASERPSTARMVFYATCAFCSTLVVWDLVF
jgi:phage-related protein